MLRSELPICMLFKNTILKKIEAGTVTLAFRRWVRPTVRVGGALRTPAGVLSIDDISEVAVEDISYGDAKRAGFETRDDLLIELSKRGDGVLYRIEFHLVGTDPRISLRGDSQLDAHALAELRDRLLTLDRHSRIGAWTMETLRLIGEKDGRTAQEIAERLGQDKATVKRKIRLLKEEGLTESLPSGYRLSERGRAAYRELRQKRR